MFKTKPLNDMKTEVLQKAELWSAESETGKQFMESDVTTKQKISNKNFDPKHEHYVVNEYNIKPDLFKVLNKTSKFKLPIWLVALFCTLASLFFIGGIVALIVSASSNHNFVTYNQKCDNVTRFCNSSKNLVCSNGLCGCANSDFHWSSSYSSCIFKGSYASSCSSTSECLESSGLYCSTIANGCNCPSTSKAFMCDCPITMYFDETSKACVDKLSYGSRCTFDKQCSQTISLVCSSTGTCACPTTHYYANLKCNIKLGYEVSCTSDGQCDDSKLLSCRSGKCSCSTGYYYDTVLRTCNLLKSYDETCSANQCDTTKSLTCSDGRCACSNGFWSSYSSVCVSCPDLTWTAFQNTACFYYSSSQSSKATVSQFCADKGAKMCQASTSSEYDLLKLFLTTKGNPDNIWMGVSKSGSTYSWQDGTSVSSSYWCSTPSSGCARLHKKSSQYCLEDKNCGDSNKYCCVKYS